MCSLSFLTGFVFEIVEISKGVDDGDIIFQKKFKDAPHTPQLSPC